MIHSDSAQQTDVWYRYYLPFDKAALEKSPTTAASIRGFHPRRVAGGFCPRTKHVSMCGTFQRHDKEQILPPNSHVHAGARVSIIVTVASQSVQKLPKAQRHLLVKTQAGGGCSSYGGGEETR